LAQVAQELMRPEEHLAAIQHLAQLRRQAAVAGDLPAALLRDWMVVPVVAAEMAGQGALEIPRPSVRRRVAPEVLDSQTQQVAAVALRELAETQVTQALILAVTVAQEPHRQFLAVLSLTPAAAVEHQTTPVLLAQAAQEAVEKVH
jgi:hypothetical protein